MSIRSSGNLFWQPWRETRVKNTSRHLHHSQTHSTFTCTCSLWFCSVTCMSYGWMVTEPVAVYQSNRGRVIVHCLIIERVISPTLPSDNTPLVVTESHITPTSPWDSPYLSIIGLATEISPTLWASSPHKSRDNPGLGRATMAAEITEWILASAWLSLTHSHQQHNHLHSSYSRAP